MKASEENAAAGIDWAASYRRLAAAAEALEGRFALAPEAAREVLRERARALAAEPPPEPGLCMEVLEFVLAREHYAIATDWVQEVVPLRELTPLPGTPAFVLGIMHLRGRVVSVLDIGRFFELPDRGLSDLNKVIVIGDGGMEFGVLADLIVGVRALPVDDIQPPLPTLTGIRADYLMGITRQREVVLDGGRLLADPAIVVAEEVAG